MEELEWEIYAAHRIKVDEGNLNANVMVQGFSIRSACKWNSDSASNYVDRVRLRDSSNSFGGPGRGSGWRQKSLSNIDLPTSYRGIAGGGGSGVGGITGGGLGAGQFRYRDYDSGLYDLYSRIDSRREEYEDLYGVNPKAARAGSAVGGRVATSEAGPGAAPSPSGGGKANGGKKRHHRSQEAVASSEHSAAGAGHQHHHHHHHHHHAAAGSGGASQQQQQAQFYNPDSNEACSLRRTRSLAVIREESYNDLHLPGGRGGSRRSQLIPRAKLTDRNFFKERFSYIYDDSVEGATKPPDGGDAAYSLARRFSSAPQQQSPASNGNTGGGQQQPPFPWHTDKSDLDSIDSSIFKHSLHQQSSFEGSRRNSVRSDSNQFVSKVEVHSEYSGGGGGGSTKSDTGVDADLRHLEDLSLRDESSSRRTITSKTSTLETIKRRSSGSGSTGAGNRAAVKYGGVKEEDESGITIIEIRDSQVSHKSSSVISYDSIYLSSESDEKDHPEDEGPCGEVGEGLPAATGRPALGDVKYEDYENLFHETDLENAESTIDTLYGQVTKPKPKPKIVGVEPKVSHSQNDSLRRYIKHTGRSTLERLSLISNLKLRQEFASAGEQQQSTRDRPAPGLKEKHPVDQCDYQYNSLPDADVCKLLRHSERIDAKLRRIADTGDEDHSGRSREAGTFGDSLPRLHRADLVALTQPPSDEDLSLEESDKGAPSIELVETPTKEVASSSKVYLPELGVELDYENSVVTGHSDPESDITIVAPQDDLDVPTPAIVITPPAQQKRTGGGVPPAGSKKQYSTFASTAGKQTTNRIHYARKEPSKPNPEALREVRTKLKPIPVPPPSAEVGPKIPLALAPTVKLGGKKVIVDEVAAKAAKREKQLEPAPKKEPVEAPKPQEAPIAIAGAKEPPEPKQPEGSPKVDHSSLFKETNPFKEQARREVKNRINDERPPFKGVRRFNSTENIYTSSPIIVTKTFNNCIKTNEVKTKSFDSLIVDHSGRDPKMPRPQVIQMVDSKHQQHLQQQQQLANGADTVRKTSKNGQQTQREFLHKVDSVRNYWSKMLDEVDQHQDECEPDSKNELRQPQELSGSKNGNAERKASIGSATSEASDSSSKHTTSTKAASSNEGNIVRPAAAVTSSRNKYSTYQLLDDEDEDELHCQSFSPTVEIIELDGHKQAALVKPKNAKDLDFDHVRYKVMKSEMFQKNLLVNHRKAAQFDGLMQYLQDYSFQELLAHNNVVIIEPVRTKIEKISDRTAGGGGGRSELPAGMCRITNGALQAASVAVATGKRLQHTVGGASAGLKKHFFYHPIRINKELLDEELPSPDTVRNVRKLFEGTLRLGTAAKQAYEDAKANGTAAVGIRKWDSASLSSGVSSSGDLSSPCDCGEAGEHGTPAAVAAGAVAHHHHSAEVLSAPTTAEAEADGGQTDLMLHESHYVSQDVLEKIRECGSTVTYYGGRVLDKRTEHISTMTRAIMREIRGQDRKCGVCQPHNCVDIGDHDHDPDDDGDGDGDEYGDDEDTAHRMCPSSRRLERPGERDGGLGVKFKLVKSNSCSSRLELAGTGKTPPDLLRPNGRMRGRHHIPEENGSGGSGSGSPIEEPEESVRDMVSRLESSGTLAPRSKPRIIESKCIEKGESPTADITINSQTTLDGATVAVDHGGDQGAPVTPVTVNNHINHVHHGAPPPPPPLVIPPLLKAPGKVDQPTAVAAAAAITSMERSTKVCRNKNVDLAFAATMRQIANLNGTTKSASSVRKSSSLVAIGAAEDGQSPPDSAPQSASSVTKTVTFNFTNNNNNTSQPVNGSVENGAPSPQQQPLPVVDQSENLRPSAIAEQRKADELTSPKLVNWSTIGRFDERQYFANDRKLIEKRKYDDMEFEEFEVLDPNAPPSSEHYDSLNSK